MSDTPRLTAVPNPPPAALAAVRDTPKVVSVARDYVVGLQPGDIVMLRAGETSATLPVPAGFDVVDLAAFHPHPIGDPS